MPLPRPRQQPFVEAVLSHSDHFQQRAEISGLIRKESDGDPLVKAAEAFDHDVYDWVSHCRTTLIHRRYRHAINPTSVGHRRRAPGRDR